MVARQLQRRGFNRLRLCCCRRHAQSEDAMTEIKGLVERWKSALPNIVGGQREIVTETITALESLAAERDRLKEANRELRNQLRGESLGRVAMVERAEAAEADAKAVREALREC